MHSFALFTEIMHAHFKKMGKVEGLKPYLSNVFQQMLADCTKMIIFVGDCWLDLFDHSHVEIRRFSKEITKNFEKMKSSATEIADAVSFGRRDKRDYRNFCHDSQFVSWQSFCTTILSNKVRIEEDIDDGSHTTVRKVQVDTELKRMGITDEAEKDKVCAELKEVSRSDEVKHASSLRSLFIIAF